MKKVGINCDMGEGFGPYTIGDDKGIMPFITEANVACGFHASDPGHMRRTVELAREHGVKVGAHVAFPDLQGFGRREMKVERAELVDMILYQVGALKGFLDNAGMVLSHIKPHGALYGMAARVEDMAQAVADVALMYGVKVIGMAGTLHEEVYTARGLEFCPEFFADLEYDSEGVLIITRKHDEVDPVQAADRCIRAVRDGKTRSIDNVEISIRAESIGVHSDTPNSVDVAREVFRAIESYNNSL